MRNAIFISLALVCAAPASGQRAKDDPLQPFLGWHCSGCHSGDEPKAGLDLLGLARRGPNVHDRGTLRRVREAVASRTMPPEFRAQPEPEEIDEVLAHIDRLLREFDAEARDTGAIPEPRAATMRRLNRVEYANTVRDLLGVDFDAARFLPADDVGAGFDNNGDVLAMPPLMLEKYFDAAERIAAAAFPDPLPDAPPIKRLAASQMRRDNERSTHVRGDAVILSSNGTVRTPHSFPMTNRYRLHVEAGGQQAGPEPVKIAFFVDRNQVGVVEVRNGYDDPKPYSVEITIEAGNHSVGAGFINDYYKPEHPDPQQRDRNCAIMSFAIEGPLDAPANIVKASDPLRERHPDRWLRETIHELADRAFRRPIVQADLHELVELAGSEGTPESRVRTALTAILVSPRFLFRPEPGSDESRDLDDFEVAARLSYFLWSSTPDDALLGAAKRGELGSDAGFVSQVDRMLDDPRSIAIAENFATQWLAVRDLEQRTPDPQRFPSVDRALLESMKAETILVFDAILREDRSVGELLASDFTFLNERLAHHYGIPGVRGDYMRRVGLAEPDARGLIAHASVLTATSNPTRTSPVKRGKFILEALLDAPPPPPPPGVASFEKAREESGGGTVREILERHRADPDCAVCHTRMDALGFALEQYDAVGRYRTTDSGMPVDSRGELPGGRQLSGLEDLRQLLLETPAFRRSLAKHLLIYALGRGLDEADDMTVDELVSSVDNEPTLRSLIHAIAGSHVFRGKQGEHE